MKVGEMLAKYPMWMRSSADRDLLTRNKESEVIAYAILAGPVESNGKHSPLAYAFIFRSKRQLIAVVNGNRKDPQIAYKVIQRSELIRHDSEDARKEVFMNAL